MNWRGPDGDSAAALRAISSRRLQTHADGVFSSHAYSLSRRPPPPRAAAFIALSADIGVEHMPPEPMSFAVFGQERDGRSAAYHLSVPLRGYDNTEETEKEGKRT